MGSEAGECGIEIGFGREYLFVVFVFSGGERVVDIAIVWVDIGGKYKISYLVGSFGYDFLHCSWFLLSSSLDCHQ